MKQNKKIVLLIIGMYMLILLCVIELGFVSAYKFNVTNDTEFQASWITTHSTVTSGTNAYDENWASWSHYEGNISTAWSYAVLYENFTKPFNIIQQINTTHKYWLSAGSGASGTAIISVQCYNGTGWTGSNLDSVNDGDTITRNDIQGILPIACYNYDNNLILVRTTCSIRGSGTDISICEYYETNITYYTDLKENSINYNNIAYETSTQNFTLNLTYDSSSYSIINAVFYYNGTSYNPTKSTSGDSAIFLNSLDIPLINLDNENKSFYWTIALTNATDTYYFNSTINNQTIYLINFSNDSSLGIKALNFTSSDQKSLSRINPFNFKGTFNYYLGSGNYSKNFSIISNSIAEQVFYIRNHTNYKISGQIQYSADNYATTDYNFINWNINNQTNNISLYLLNLTFSTSFILKVQDNNQVPLTDYLIYIYRYDTGSTTPYLVQVTKTDSSGKSIGFFETETVDYKFVITDNLGNIVYTSEKKKIIPETTPYTLIFTVGYVTPSPFSYYENVTGFDYQLTYNKNTYIVTYIYTDSNTSFINATLIVKYLNSSINQSIVCYSSWDNPSGVINCDIGNYSGTYSATAYINRGEEILIDNIIIEINSIARVFGNLGLMVGFFIILICGTAFLFNEVAGVISINVGIIFVQLISLINFGWVFVFGVIAISIIALIILERG